MNKGVVPDEKESAPFALVRGVSVVAVALGADLGPLSTRDAAAVGALTRIAVDYVDGVDRILRR